VARLRPLKTHETGKNGIFRHPAAGKVAGSPLRASAARSRRPSAGASPRSSHLCSPARMRRAVADFATSSFERIALKRFLLQWPTLVTLVMFPVLVYMYVRLARREERDALAEFGEAYAHYAATTPAFIPRFSAPQRRSGVTNLKGDPS